MSELAALVGVAVRLLRTAERVEGLDVRAELLEHVRVLLEHLDRAARRTEPGGGREYLATLRLIRDVVATHRAMAAGVENELRHRSRRVP